MSFAFYEAESKATKHEWKLFLSWYQKQQIAFENRTAELVGGVNPTKANAKRLERMRAEFIAAARKEWLQRLQRAKLRARVWVMSSKEKKGLNELLWWDREKLVEAATEQDEAMAARISEASRVRYERVDPSTLGGKENGVNSPSIPVSRVESDQNSSTAR